MMLLYSAFCRPLVALALLFSAFALSFSPASARPHHGAYRTMHAHYAYRHAPRGFARQTYAQPQFFGQPNYPQVASYPQTASYPRKAYHQRVERRHVEQTVALTRLRKFADTQASTTPYEPGGSMVTSGSSSSLVMEAREFLGTKPSGMGGSLWCARFMNMVLEKTGHQGTGSAMASSFASYGHRVSGPEVGAIAVMGRRGGGHVGIITGVDASGNPIMISGNNGNRVREAPISRGRIYAYVMPN
jgi:uncharacterized protein (TIGR02594 family)